MKVIVTLKSRKGTEWQLETTRQKLPTVKSNARQMGYKIIKIEEMVTKCDKCDKPARFITSRSSACSEEHAPAWVARARA